MRGSLTVDFYGSGISEPDREVRERLLNDYLDGLLASYINYAEVSKKPGFDLGQNGDSSPLSPVASEASTGSASSELLTQAPNGKFAFRVISRPEADKLAARKASFVLLGRPVGSSDLSFFGVNTAIMWGVSVPESPLCRLVTGQLSLDDGSHLVAAAIASTLTVGYTLSKLPKLVHLDCCLYVHALRERSKLFTEADAQRWIPSEGDECDVPKYQCWNCRYRGENGMCCCREQHRGRADATLETALRDSLKAICDSGYIDESKNNGGQCYIIS